MRHLRNSAITDILGTPYREHAKAFEYVGRMYAEHRDRMLLEIRRWLNSVTGDLPVRIYVSVYVDGQGKMIECILHTNGLLDRTGTITGTKHTMKIFKVIESNIPAEVPEIALDRECNREEARACGIRSCYLVPVNDGEGPSLACVCIDNYRERLSEKQFAIVRDRLQHFPDKLKWLLRDLGVLASAALAKRDLLRFRALNDFILLSDRELQGGNRFLEFITSFISGARLVLVRKRNSGEYTADAEPNMLHYCHYPPELISSVRTLRIESLPYRKTLFSRSRHYEPECMLGVRLSVWKRLSEIKEADPDAEHLIRTMISETKLPLPEDEATVIAVGLIDPAEFHESLEPCGDPNPDPSSIIGQVLVIVDRPRQVLRAEKLLIAVACRRMARVFKAQEHESLTDTLRRMSDLSELGHKLLNDGKPLSLGETLQLAGEKIYERCQLNGVLLYRKQGHNFERLRLQPDTTTDCWSSPVEGDGNIEEIMALGEPLYREINAASLEEGERSHSGRVGVVLYLPIDGSIAQSQYDYCLSFEAYSRATLDRATSIYIFLVVRNWILSIQNLGNQYTLNSLLDRWSRHFHLVVGGIRACHYIHETKQKVSNLIPPCPQGSKPSDVSTALLTLRDQLQHALVSTMGFHDKWEAHVRPACSLLKIFEEAAAKENSSVDFAWEIEAAQYALAPSWHVSVVEQDWKFIAGCIISNAQDLALKRKERMNLKAIIGCGHYPGPEGQAEMISIVICDSGPGYSPTVLEAFKNYHGSEPDPVMGGSGMGLLFSRLLVDWAGGEMALENASRGESISGLGGAVIRILIPRRSPAKLVYGEAWREKHVRDTHSNNR